MFDLISFDKITLERQIDEQQKPSELSVCKAVEDGVAEGINMYGIVSQEVKCSGLRHI